ncbi:MAG TPA: Hint domain-containing protein, partial [Actinomycetota bacterium]|nr:Hint domain-containing protein [Actinomycetota bacterium]
GWIDEPIECPICLTPGTRIDTPNGLRAIEAMKPGDPVWTTDADGNRIAGRVVQVVERNVVVPHTLLGVHLRDGRRIRISPGHPLTDGRTIRDLAAGDPLDGSSIIAVSVIRSRHSVTRDLLPSGPTGHYWANGIRMGSTLHHAARPTVRRDALVHSGRLG